MLCSETEYKKKNSNLASTALFSPYNSTNGRMGVLCMCVCVEEGVGRQLLILKVKRRGLPNFWYLVTKHTILYYIIYTIAISCA